MGEMHVFLDIAIKTTPFIIAFLVIASGYRAVRVRFENDMVIFKGSFYKETLYKNNYHECNLVNEHPKLRFRTNGYSFLGRHRGYYRTLNKEKVKVFIDGKQDKYLMIKRDGKPVFYYGGQYLNEVYNFLTSAKDE